MEMTRAEDHNSFYLGEIKVMDLKELYDALIDPENEEAAKAHINGERNDYSDWLKEVLKEEELASNISDKSDVSKIAQNIKERLDSLGVSDAAAPQTPAQDEQVAQPKEGQETEQPADAQSQPGEESTQAAVPAEQQPVQQDTPLQESEQQAPEQQQTQEQSQTQPQSEAQQPAAQETAPQSDLTPPPVQGPQEQKPPVSQDAAITAQAQTQGDVMKKANNTRHFCPKFFDCMKKEFFFGLALGIIIGIIAGILLKLGFI